MTVKLHSRTIPAADPSTRSNPVAAAERKAPPALAMAVQPGTTGDSFEPAAAKGLAATMALPQGKPTPTWVGNASVQIGRGPGTGADATKPFLFDSWARERADTTKASFEAWVPGLSDAAEIDKTQFEARVHFRVNDGPLQTMPATLDGKAGNNARFAFDLRAMDPFRQGEPPPSANEMRVEYFFSVNGAPVRPSSGESFQGVFTGRGAAPLPSSTPAQAPATEAAGGPAPTWTGNVTAAIGRGPTSGRNAAEPFRFDSWSRQRAETTKVGFEAYLPGITDASSMDAQKLKAELHYRFGGSGQFQSRPAVLDGKVGNNAHFAVDLRQVDPFAQGASPRPTGPTKMEYYFTLNGAQVRPDNAQTFQGVFE
ncbi:MAG: hypothetical protein HY901_00150 [Deltaproteobacteria bacterium]|nr:hypothetical protein [Deltaproteobacteria bacterium]